MLSREKDFGENRFLLHRKIRKHGRKEYEYNAIRELVTLYLFLKDMEVKHKNRLKRALFLVSNNDKQGEVGKTSKRRTQEVLYQLEYTPIVLEEVKILAKALFETQEKLKEVKMIESQVPEDHVLQSRELGNLLQG